MDDQGLSPVLTLLDTLTEDSPITNNCSRSRRGRPGKGPSSSFSWKEPNWTSSATPNSRKTPWYHLALFRTASGLEYHLNGDSLTTLNTALQPNDASALLFGEPWTWWRRAWILTQTSSTVSRTSSTRRPAPILQGRGARTRRRRITHRAQETSRWLPAPMTRLGSAPHSSSSGSPMMHQGITFRASRTTKGPLSTISKRTSNSWIRTSSPSRHSPRCFPQATMSWACGIKTRVTGSNPTTGQARSSCRLRMARCCLRGAITIGRPPAMAT